jgi:benzoylformate decarboxylase
VAAVVPPAPEAQEPIAPAHVFAAIAERLPAESTLVEESPSTRGLLIDLVPTRAPLGFLTPAMGGLGFALAAATGVKLALPERPVVAVVGDGASLYNIQTLWSAAHYDVGALFVIMSNGGYAVMDRLALNAGGKPPWPSFGEISVSRIAEGFGCPTRRIEAYDELLATLDEVMPSLGSRREPLLLDVAVST